MAFMDARQAYDTAWRDGLLHRLWQRGVRGRVWQVCASLLAHTQASACVNGRRTVQWDDVAGVRQGAILSPIEFLAFIDDLAQQLQAAMPGVALGPEPDAPRVRVLFYADDVVLLAETEEDMRHAGYAAMFQEINQ